MKERLDITCQEVKLRYCTVLSLSSEAIIMIRSQVSSSLLKQQPSTITTRVHGLVAGCQHLYPVSRSRGDIVIHLAGCLVPPPCRTLDHVDDVTLALVIISYQ